MKLNLDYDDHGCALCPLCEDVPAWASDCHSSWRGVFLAWEFNIPIGSDHSVFEAPEAHEYATASGWKVECVNGHVLAVSSEEEDAEPFDPAALFGLPARA